MKVTLGNLRWRRVKMLFVFLVCMGSSIAVIAVVHSDKLSGVFLLAGLCIYGVIVELPWIKSASFEIYVENRITEFNIQKKRKEYRIQKDRIRDVYLKEIRYGGKWLDVIGYRLIVVADRKYIFDSVPLEEETASGAEDIKKLLELFQEAVKDRGRQGV